MLNPCPLPGLLITATDTGVGKTLVTGAIARWFLGDGARVAVCKPCATGCVRRREGLVSEDAEFLAHCAQTRHPLDLICPQRYAEPLAPAIAAQRSGRPIDWEAIDRSFRLMSADNDVMLVEGIGGAMVPMDDKHIFLDVIAWLRLAVVVVALPKLGTINHTLLTLSALRSRGIRIAGVVINRYPTDTPSTAEETNPRAIEKWGKTQVLCVVPEAHWQKDLVQVGLVPPGVASAIGTVDWADLGKPARRR